MTDQYDLFGAKDKELPIFTRARIVLGIGRDADERKIKNVYRKLSLKWHPDNYSGKSDDEKKQAEDNFKLYSDAYGVLTKDKEKAAQDFSEALQSPFVIGDRSFCLGTLYGTRIYVPNIESLRITDPSRLLGGNISAEPQKKVKKEIYKIRDSILKDSFSDLMYTFYGGDSYSETSFSEYIVPEIEREFPSCKGIPREIHQRGFERRGEGGLDDLPWIRDNDLAVYKFFERNFEESVKLFHRINKAVKGNVIFMYRDGVCLEARAAQNGFERNNREWTKDMELATSLYRAALSRIKGDNSKLTILMQLADAYESMGRIDGSYLEKSREVWQKVKDIDPTCCEAIIRSKKQHALTQSGWGNIGKRILGLLGR